MLDSRHEVATCLKLHLLRHHLCEIHLNSEREVVSSHTFLLPPPGALTVAVIARDGWEQKCQNNRMLSI